MPGYSPECVSGTHQACVERECRCACHPWTHALLNQPVKKSDLSGGYRRDTNVMGSTTTNVIASTTQAQLQNTCPQCGEKAAATDRFCRKDGSKLLLGMQCLGCGAPEEPSDLFCWQCGLRAGEKPAPPPTAEPESREDAIERIKRLAREKGLLKETVV